jgi:transposase-like protein
MAKYSKYIGVSFDKKRNKWFASIKNNGKCKFLGYAATEEEAYKKRLEAESLMSEILSKNILTKQKNEIIQMYLSGETINEIASRLNKDYSTIREHLINSKTELRDDRVSPLLNPQKEQEIVDLYSSGLSIQKTSKKTCIPVTTVFGVIQKLHKTRPNRKYHFKDECFLKKIDAEWKAYFLGLLWADGNMRDISKKNNSSSSISITLTEKDSYLLEDLAKEIFQIAPPLYYKKSYTHVDKKSGKTYTGKPSKKLSINSKIVYQDLLDMGCSPAKSLTAVFPDIPTEYFHHFMRGYFDGDGWFSKDRSFGLIGSHIFCEVSKQKLKNFTGIDFRIVECGKVARLLSGSRVKMQKFYDFLYQDATIFLKRKKEKAELQMFPLY